MSLHILQCPCNVLPLFVPCSTVTDGKLDVSQQKTTYAKVFVLVFSIVDAEVFPAHFEVKKYPNDCQVKASNAFTDLNVHS